MKFQSYLAHQTNYKFTNKKLEFMPLWLNNSDNSNTNSYLYSQIKIRQGLIFRELFLLVINVLRYMCLIR